MEEILPEKDWRNLIRDIHNGQVVPVVGPELITIADPATGKPTPLYQYLAPRLASRLQLDRPDSFTSVNETACAYILDGGSRKDVYDELRELIDELQALPGDALLDLARIKDFNFFVASTFDHQMSLALKTARPEFDPRDHLLTFHPVQPVDIPEPITGTRLYHILGDYNTYPDFAVWEEDYMEYICGLIEHQDTMERLFRLLKRRQLLLLGAPASDWIVRFFLRVTRQERLSDRSDNVVGEYLAAKSASLEPPLIYFFDKLIHATRVISGDPAAFIAELSRRWQERYGQAGSDNDFLSRLPSEMPRDSIFISYAREDLAAALNLARVLHNCGIPVWLDKGRLQAGENYEESLEAAVRVHSSFFLSLISETTEADAERKRFVHRERDWAGSRHMDGFIYYLPIAIYTQVPEHWQPKAEPECFSRIHYHSLPNGQTGSDFVEYLRWLVGTYRTSGRPRG
ncbi:MAG TPA: toll/interleukin-1 receptor domain-containing protein [Chthoniobacterales bacterium]